MNFNSDFVTPQEFCRDLTLEQYQQQFSEPLSNAEKVWLFCCQGILLAKANRFEVAIATYQQALDLQPDYPPAFYFKGLALQSQGKFQEAIAAYRHAIQLHPQKSSLVWIAQADALQNLQRHREAIAAYQQALSQDSCAALALSGQSVAWATLGQQQRAIACCNQAMALSSNDAKVLTHWGLVLLMGKRLQDAVQQFDAAIALQPDLGQAWYGRGSALLRLGEDQEAIASLEQALLHSTPYQSWQAKAWGCYAYALGKVGQHQEAIAICEDALNLQPQLYSAAWCKLMSLIFTGNIFAYAIRTETRSKLWRDLRTIFYPIKYQLLFLLVGIGLLTFGQWGWVQAFRRSIPILLSLGIVAFLTLDLWKNRAKLNFVWQMYFGNSPLTYLRVIGILVGTLTTSVVAYGNAPPFMQWGWSNWVFGQSGNVIFQPLINLIEFSASRTTWLVASTNLMGSLPLTLATHLAAVVPTVEAIAAQFNHAYFNFTTLLIIAFWLLLLLGIPFWAKLEEYIFRRGANNWKQICVRSIQFGLVHLLAGVPLIGGVILILPGFLFACRYKYVYERHLRKTNNLFEAQEAGVLASTADHALYNAILVTMLTLFLLIFQGNIAAS
jgi:tetratricopeptide (TPR) repeat protein